MENIPSQTEEQNEDLQNNLMEEIKEPDELYKGKIVEGTVVLIDHENVWVDVNYKSEGKIPISEFEVKPNENDKFYVKVVTLSDKSGDLWVSKRGADANKMRTKLKNAYETNEIITGKVTKEAKNGLKVDFDGIEGYVPLSHMELGKASASEHYIGRDFEFQIIKFEARKNISVVVSRKNILQNIKSKRIKEIFDTVKVGDIIEGNVKNITRVGVFVDLQGIDGLIRHEDISWKRGVNPNTILKKDDLIKIKVVNLDQEKQRIGLSLKHLESDPFIEFSEKVNKDDIVTGKVIKLESFGAFIEVADGVEGLLHISELSWVKRINHPKEILKTGSEIQVKILDIDKENRKLSLGFRQLIQNPYETLDIDYPLGSKHSGKINNITDFGIFIELSTGIEGLVRKEDITWDKKEKNVLEQFSPGEIVEVQILKVDKKSKKIGLGIKQLLDNPLETFKFNNPPGKKIKGKVVRITDFGAFVELAKGIEGLIHISHLAEERVNKVTDIVSVGKEVEVKILSIDIENNKISLSIKDLEKDISNELINQHTGEDKGTFRLGDMINLSDLAKKK